MLLEKHLFGFVERKKMIDAFQGEHIYHSLIQTFRSDLIVHLCTPVS